VDDEESDLETMRRTLGSDQRFRTSTAADFHEAVKVFENCAGEVDLAILDVALPGKTAWNWQSIS
jgi:DNA-binding response OmpR family regulator